MPEQQAGYQVGQATAFRCAVCDCTVTERTGVAIEVVVQGFAWRPPRGRGGVTVEASVPLLQVSVRLEDPRLVHKGKCFEIAVQRARGWMER